MTEIKITRCERLKGVAAAARRLGVSQGHLSRVLKGERKPGKVLARKLWRLDIKL